MLSLVDIPPRPLLTRASAGAEDNRYGFEGGRCLWVDRTCHLFVSEMFGDPHFIKSRLAHWTSPDLLHFRRQATLYESSGDSTGHDPRAALFLPQPVFNEAETRWNLFYAAFCSKPNEPGRWLLNHAGRIIRAISQTPGYDGIAGPYVDAGIILQPSAESDPWEGLQGTDSFFPYPVGDEWLAFYGSARTQQWPCDFWGVGLASAPRLAGPWTRCSQRNPVRLDHPFVENPIVCQRPDGSYLALYDCQLNGRALGFATSPDGRAWSAGRHLDLSAIPWVQTVRTPLGLLPTGAANRYILPCTAVDTSNYRSIGVVSVIWDA
jgi:hypothetical protein